MPFYYVLVSLCSLILLQIGDSSLRGLFASFVRFANGTLEVSIVFIFTCVVLRIGFLSFDLCWQGCNISWMELAT